MHYPPSITSLTFYYTACPLLHCPRSSTLSTVYYIIHLLLHCPPFAMHYPPFITSPTFYYTVHSITFAHLLLHCQPIMTHNFYLIHYCVNIGLGNGLLPDGTKPLPEPMLTYPTRHCTTAKRPGMRTLALSTVVSSSSLK